MSLLSISLRLRPLTSMAVLGFLFLPAGAAPAFAKEEACVAASPNGKVFGKRFGKLLGAAGVAAITGKKAAARAAADAAVRDVGDSARENAVAEASAAACRQGEQDDASSPEGGDVKKGSGVARRAGRYARPDQIPVPAEIKAQKAAFNEFGKVFCSDCEGSYSYDSWAKLFFYSELQGNPHAWVKKLAAMEAGDAVTWEGTVSTGTITMQGLEQRYGFDCKVYIWTLRKGGASAEREGLLCRGAPDEFVATNNWVEIY
ncbi:hypothetical protein [Sphingopyxis sp. MWB1]|uniref:hypothetical protein n=1 Tax=Sphingopyxis sp. MWB1 TaxID=1537715 RepID=UPI00051A1EB5|nr:hypothetical protein [Sphingopyxis sp. MWB1]